MIGKLGTILQIQWYLAPIMKEMFIDDNPIIWKYKLNSSIITFFNP